MQSFNCKHLATVDKNNFKLLKTCLIYNLFICMEHKQQLEKLFNYKKYTA